MPDQRSGGIGESTVTVKWWAVLTVIISIFGFVILGLMNHENRITKGETQFSYIAEAMSEMRGVLKDIRDDQIRRYEKELRDSRSGK